MVATIIANNTDRLGAATPQFGVQSGSMGRFSRAFDFDGALPVGIDILIMETATREADVH